jgi:class 3 adenylate cyclase/tetratricopeptide (TPR) repeat protein/energy-coupling factor transporter ATP-binding protein EcfA2
MIYAFAGYSLDAERRALCHGAAAVGLEPQTFDLLLYLIQHRDHVVSKDELLGAVWCGRIVSDSTLSSQIAVARQAIGDDGHRQQFVRTFARKGFRFVGEVLEQKDRPGDGAGSTIESQPLPVTPLVKPVRPERRQITVMICDLSGEGRAADDPEALMERVSDDHRCIESVAASQSGFVAKSLGYQVVVFFGYPQAGEDDAERAVRAGLALVSELWKRNDAKARTRARIAIATGLVVVGDLGSSGATMARGAIGDAPQLAADLLARTRPGAIIIAAETRRMVGDLFVYRDLGSVALKPGADPVPAWQVLRENTIASRFEALHPQHARLIGRDEEMELLRRRWGQIKSGEGRVVLIYGEPGIGKSRLALAIQGAIVDEQHRSLRFYCSPHRSQTALHPVISQLEYTAGLSAAISDTVKLDRLTALIGQSSWNTVDDTALFADLLAIPTPDGLPRLSLSPQRRKELLLERLISQLEGLAAQAPLLMVLEDAHWIDPTTRELFDVVVERIRSLPVLLIITYRPEFSPPWLGQSHVTVLTLNRLGRRDNVALVKQVAGENELSPELLEQIVKQTDGVPLFIEEVTKSVIEGEAREVRGSGQFATPSALAIPATLQASLIARLDRLSPARDVVQVAAALGRDFSYAMLRAVCGLDDAELSPLLDQLVTSELVHQRGKAPHALYTFKHALVQDAAYSTMLRGQRLEIHKRIVAVLEQEFAEVTERSPEVLAHHCTEAEILDKAIDYWLRSARMALDRSAGIEAQAQVNKAKVLLTRISDQDTRRQLEGRVQIVRSDTLVMTEGFASPAVAAALSQALTLLDKTVHPVETVRALCGLCNYHLMRSESPKALQLAEPLLQSLLDRPSATVTHLFAGAACLHIGRFKDAAAHLEQALALYDDSECRPLAFTGGHHVRSFSRVWLSLTYLYLGRLQQAMDTIAAAVADARSRQHPFTLVSTLLASARFHIHIGDLETARTTTDEGFKIATEQRSPYHVSRASILRAANVVLDGKPVEGIALMDRALIDHHATGANFQSSFNLSCLAEAYALARDYPRALDYASRAIGEVTRTGEHWWSAEAQRIKGTILLKASPKNRHDAETCFKAALDQARTQDAKFFELRAACDLAAIWQAGERNAEAVGLLGPIYAVFGGSVELPDIDRAKQLLRSRDSRKNSASAL